VSVAGIIAIWSGAIVDIPAGWVLCDGNNGTPNLMDRFVVGAGDTYNPNDTGGTYDHTHGFTSDTHQHNIGAGDAYTEGAAFAGVSSSEVVTGETDSEDNIPPYYALAYIMKT